MDCQKSFHSSWHYHLNTVFQLRGWVESGTKMLTDWPVLTILISRVSPIVWLYVYFKKCGKFNNISWVLLCRIMLSQHTKTSSIYSDAEKCFMLLWWFCQLEMVKKIVRSGHFILTFRLIPFYTRISIVPEILNFFLSQVHRFYLQE